MSRNLQSLTELKRALALYAETVCSHYLTAGEKSGHYWRVGDIDGSGGRSMFVSLAGASAGQWSDPAQGTHGDLLDIIAHHEGTFGRACRAARELIGTSPAPPQPAPGDEPNPHLKAAKHNWTCARPIERTHASRYLASRGIAIRLDAAGDTVAVGEGLETMLSLRTAFPTLPIAAAMGNPHPRSMGAL